LLDRQIRRIGAVKDLSWDMESDPIPR
jgi:hypothetical protein